MSKSFISYFKPEWTSVGMFGKSSIYRFKNVLYLYDFQQSGRTWYIMQELFYKLILISTLLALLVSTKAGYGQSENIEQDRGENSLSLCHVMSYRN